MGWGWLGTSSFLLVVAALVAYVALTRVSRTQLEPIGAEKMASDVLDDEYVPALSENFAATDESYKSVPKSWRLAIFAVGSVSLVLSVVFAVIALMTSLSWVAPVTFLFFGVGSLAFLRLLAVRDQRAKIVAKTDVASPHSRLVRASSTSHTSSDVTTNRNQVAQSTSPRRAPNPKPVAASVKSLRYARTHREYRRFDVASNERPVVQSAETVSVPLAGAQHEALRVENTAWAPVEVPKPLYLDVEEHFQDVEPLPVSPQTQAKSKTLTEAASGSVRLDLDDVLNRRRA